MSATWFMRVRAFDGTGAEVYRSGNFVRAIARIGLNRPFGNTAALGSPCWSLGDPLLVFAEHVRLHLIEPDRMRCDVFLVVQIFGNPNVHDRKVECRIGVRQNRNPLDRIMANCRIVAA